MEFYKLVFKALTLTLTLQLPLVSCGPHEPMLELSLERQAMEKPFTLAEYCEEEYDSVYIIYPYDDSDKIQRLPYKMSSNLRNYCSSTSADTYSTILFIRNGAVEAFAEVKYDKAIFSPPHLPEKLHIFHFKQLFILNKERRVLLYKE